MSIATERKAVSAAADEWAVEGQELTQRHAVASPGSRPSEWWQYECREPRTVIRGRSHPLDGYELRDKWHRQCVENMEPADAAAFLHGEGERKRYRDGVPEPRRPWTSKECARSGYSHPQPPAVFESQDQYLDRTQQWCDGEQAAWTRANPGVLATRLVTERIARRTATLGQYDDLEGRTPLC